MTLLARRERHSLCDLALLLGPDAPTLCGDWRVRDLVAHLLVREGNPLSAAGILVPPLAGFTEKAMAQTSKRPFPDLVDALRDPGLSPFRIPLLERLINTTEFFVHHEDLRRAQPDWAPRTLADADEDQLWPAVRIAGRLLVRPAGVPVTVRRADRTGVSTTLRSGAAPDLVTMIGRPCEVMLFLFGRQAVADVELDGPADAVERLRTASLGG